MVSFELDVRVEICRRLFCDLIVQRLTSRSRCPAIAAYQCLGFLYMLMAEKELAIQIAYIDSVQVNDVDLSKARQDKILQQFASNSASANH